MADESIAIIGGTGKLGTGLAARWALAGRRVIIGSRREDAAVAAAARLTTEHPSTATLVTGMTNAAAVEASGIAVVSVPFAFQTDTLAALADVLSDRILVSAAVPLRFDVDSGAYAVDVPEGSAAEQVARLVPAARVVAGFHTVSSVTLQRVTETLDGDVLLCGDDPDAKHAVADLVRAIPRLRAVDAGPLRLARHVEAIAVVLLGINRRSRHHTGVSVAGLPDDRAF